MPTQAQSQVRKELFNDRTKNNVYVRPDSYVLVKS